MSGEGKESDRSKEEGGLYNSPGTSGQIFRKTMVQAITVAVIVALLLLAWEAVPILLLIFAGILLAVLLDFCGRQFMRLPRIPHWLGVTISLIIIIALLVLLIMLAVPMLVEETQELSSQLQKSIEELVEWLERNAGGRLVAEQLATLVEDDSNDLDLWGRIAGVFSSTMEAITGIAIISVVGVFLAYSPGMYTKGFLHLFPIGHRERAAEVMTVIGTTLRWWLLGQIISMIILAVTTWIMLTLMKVPLALILALITGMMTFIPYLGPLLALIPIILLSFLQSPLVALYAFILYMGIQNMEANVIMPIIFHRTAHIPPAIGVISQILVGSLFGVLGFILAIPLMAVVLQFMKMVYVEDVLGDKGAKESST